MRNIMSRWLLASALGAVVLTQASASIVFHFNAVHSGAMPVGPASWAVMTMNDIPGGVQISLTNNATNSTGQFIGQLNLLFTPQPTGSNFSSDPYVQSISLGNFTDAGLGFNVKVAFKKPALQRYFLEGLPLSSCLACLRRTLSGRTIARWYTFRTSRRWATLARSSRLSRAA